MLLEIVAGDATLGDAGKLLKPVNAVAMPPFAQAVRNAAISAVSAAADVLLCLGE